MNDCTRCRLSSTRRCIVKPQGFVENAQLLFITEGPSKIGEMFKTPMGGPEIRLMDDLVKDASAMANHHEPLYAVTSIVLCRPTDEKNGEGRPVKADEVLACAGNFMKTVAEIDAKAIVFIGKQVERFYHKEFPWARMMQHPSFLLKQGGKGSSWYTLTARMLSEVIETNCGL